MVSEEPPTLIEVRVYMTCLVGPAGCMHFLKSSLPTMEVRGHARAGATASARTDVPSNA